MKKRLLLAAAVVMGSLSSFAYETGEYVYTDAARFQITDANNLYLGGSDLSKWTVLSATDGATINDVFASDEDGTVGKYFYSKKYENTEGIYYDLTLTQGTYVVSFKIAGPAASAGVPLQSTHNALDYTFLTDLNRTNYINIEEVVRPDSIVSVGFTESTVPASWETLAFGFEANGSSTYRITFKGMNPDVKIADIQVQAALPAADLRKKDFALKYAQATLAALGLDETTLPEDLEEVYTTFKGMDETTTVEEFEAYLEEFNAVMADFRAMNFDDQLSKADSHFAYYEGTSKKQKFSEWGEWNCYPGGRGHVDPAPGYVHMGHYAGYVAWGGSDGSFCGIDQAINLVQGKYFFKAELQGFYREERKSSCWNNDDGLQAIRAYMYVLNEAGDTVATTGWYNVAPNKFTPNVLSFEIQETGNYTVGLKAYEHELYVGCLRGGALNILDVELMGKTTAKYSKAQYDYEIDVRGQITAGRDALTTAQGYVDSADYKWGKAELNEAIAAIEPIIGAYEIMDQDAVIATYDMDQYDSSKGLEDMDEEATYYYRLLASEVYRTGAKLILDANKAFLAKNDTLASLATAIAKAEAELVNRVYDASTEKAQLEAEVATAKALLATMQASEYSVENAAAIVAENAAIDAAIATYQVIPADKLTSIVDIDFNQFTIDGANVPEGPDATIEGNKGSMVFTNFSNVTSGQPFEVGIDNAGAKDSVNVLRVGNGTATVDFAANMVGTTNILRVSMDWYIGKLSGKYCGFYLRDADDANVGGINFSSYDGKCDYDPCDMAGKFGVATFSVGIGSSSQSNLAICNASSNLTNMVLYLDYGTMQMQLVSTTPKGVYASDWVAFEGQEVAKFVLSSNYNNSDRRSWFDNLKIDVIEAGVPTGIQTVNTVKANNGVMFNIAGQAVSNTFKGIVVKDGKKFVK